VRRDERGTGVDFAVQMSEIGLERPVLPGVSLRIASDAQAKIGVTRFSNATSSLALRSPSVAT